MQEIIEGTTTVLVPRAEKVDKKMHVFYNPVMKLNRDLSLLVLSTMEHPRIALPMEASGVRAARILNEIKDLKVHSIAINDLNPQAIELARKNLEQMRQDVEISYHCKDASTFLREEKPFDYIDIDPFGSPNPFLDAAVQAIRRNGILAVTATDTSALAGTYARTTARKYWSKSSRTWAMHEIGLRILARKVQLIAAQYALAARPILSVSTDHYYRIFFAMRTGADATKEIIRQHGYMHIDTQRATITISQENTADVPVAGPLWIGQLHDTQFVQEMLKNSAFLNDMEAKKLLRLIKEETRINIPGFLDIHTLCSTYRLEPPKRDLLLEELAEHGARTHISPTGFKTDLPVEEIVDILKKLKP